MDNHKPIRTEVLNRRDLLTSAVVAAVFPTIAGGLSRNDEDASFDLEEISIADLQAGMTSGKWTSRSLVEKYLQRIERFDKNGPKLLSVIEVNPDALALAEALDKERKDKGPRSTLHGIPILIKDNIDTADRMATTAGSLALVEAKPSQDAFVVQRLRQAGAVLLGKTNLSEWANFRSSRSTSGWSGRGGLTKNPYVLNRNPSGSSSGSAVAVSANLCSVSVGTETDGSIVSPASVNGIVGIKPTVGLISRAGIIPISHTQDTAGPMARTVRDAAILLGVLAGADPEDQATSVSDRKQEADYQTCLDRRGLRDARIGVARNFFGFHDGVDQVMRAALEVMQRQGALLVDPANIPNMEKVNDAETAVLTYEFKTGVNAYLARLGPQAPVHSLQELIKFNEGNRAREMPYFGQDRFEKAQSKGPLTEMDYLRALDLCRRLMRTEGIDAVMDKHRLDAIVAPTEGPAWLTDFILGDHFLGGSSTAAAVAGYPSISVPAGFVSGLPIGISFFGRAWSEPPLLRLAYAFEQATNARKPPRFLDTAN